MGTRLYHNLKIDVFSGAYVLLKNVLVKDTTDSILWTLVVYTWLDRLYLHVKSVEKQAKCKKPGIKVYLCLDKKIAESQDQSVTNNNESNAISSITLQIK